MRNIILLITCVAGSFAFAQQPIPQSARRIEKVGRVEADTKLEGRYEGKWVTTWHKKLDGMTNCEIKQLSADRWKGRFWGEWQRVPFDYTVEFAKSQSNKSQPPKGQPNKSHSDQPSSEAKPMLVEGKAIIDGASYDWTGKLTADNFDIQFTGSRYNGSVELARVAEKKSPDKVAQSRKVAADTKKR